MALTAALARWPARRWLAAAAATVLTYLVVAVPTGLIPTPFFSREIPPTWWSYPALGITAAFTGLLVATYIARAPAGDQQEPGIGAPSRFGAAGTVVSFFAVGCPVCNKLALLALGTTGALQYFEPIQPLLAGASVLMLAWAFRKRAVSEDRCPLPPAWPAPTGPRG
ncbi:MAG: hypothetical protein NVS2B15_14820 [Pseudarthrobacter sp.]